MAYDTHDVDDGLRSGYLSMEDFAEVELWQRGCERVRRRWPDIDSRVFVPRVVSAIVDLQVQDLVAESERRLADSGVTCVEDVRSYPAPLIAFSDELMCIKVEMQEFLRDNLYRHYRTVKMAEKGKRFIEAIFTEYLREPDQLPRHHREVLEVEGTMRVICDYIAGMTDRFCSQEYARLFVPETGLQP